MDDVVVVGKAQLLRPRVSGADHVSRFFLWLTENVTILYLPINFGYAMIFPLGVQFHAEHRLLAWRPCGLLDQSVISDVVATLNQLEMELHEPFNRFSDTAGIEQVDLNYEYVISVALYRRFAYAHRPPIRSAILATHPKFIHYAQLHALLTRGSPIDVRIFPDDRTAVAQWLDVPVELIAAESRSNSVP